MNKGHTNCQQNATETLQKARGKKHMNRVNAAARPQLSVGSTSSHTDPKIENLLIFINI